MKLNQYLKTALMASALFVSASNVFAADVGVSVSIGQPGFYGRIDIGDFPYPQPRLIYRSPVVVYPAAGVVYEPLYLRVPPGHYKNWKRYCGRYEACGYPVYFVQDRWYQHEYAPIYRERHGNHDFDHPGRNGNNYDRGNRHKNNGHGRGRD